MRRVSFLNGDPVERPRPRLKSGALSRAAIGAHDDQRRGEVAEFRGHLGGDR